jgi:hypothetical protein
VIKIVNMLDFLVGVVEVQVVRLEFFGVVEVQVVRLEFGWSC